MGQRETSVVRKRWLRMELRRIREESGRTQRGVAEALGWSTSKVIRLETGAVNISTSDVMALLHFYGIGDRGLVDRLVAVTRTREEGWWDAYRSYFNQQFINFLGYEDSATRIRQYMGQIVPGLLQTEEYARALAVSYPEPDKEQIDRGVRIRMRRQELLDGPHCPELIFVLDEAAVHRWVGGPEVMLSQLTRLKELAHQPGLRVLVVPFSHGMYAGLRGSSFTIFEFPSHDYVVILEDPHRDVILNDPETSSTYLETFLAVQQHAEEDIDKIIDSVIERIRLGAMV